MLEKGNLVVLESTNQVGTTEKLADWLAEKCPDHSFSQQKGGDADISVAHCLERVLPDKVLQGLVNNDLTIGGMTPSCSKVATHLYKTFVKGEWPTTTARTKQTD